MSYPSAVYCDNAATTHMSPEVAQVLATAYSQSWANPASLHSAGRCAQAVLEDAKDRLKALCVGSLVASELRGWQVVFTSGGTEANNLAIRGLTAASSAPILVGAVEHPSILSLAHECAEVRSRFTVAPVDSRGHVDLAALSAWCLAHHGGTSPPLVSIMVANNETGILSDLATISQICKKFGALLHADAVQAFGKLDPSVWVPWVDAFSVSAHKIHGPVGIGALVLRSTCKLQPILFGGGQQLGLRPGTESVPLAVGFMEAGRLVEQRRLNKEIDRVAELRELFERLLLDADLGAEIIGKAAVRSPHICSVAFPGLDRQALLMALDMAGVHCSSGSACASGSSQPSHVLTAMGLPPLWVAGALRFSFSLYSTLPEIKTAAERVALVVRKMRNRAS